MTLLRYLRSVGLRPVAAGNLKGMVDHYRTPDTQRSFALKYDQDPRKVTSFADATKLSMETTVLANATGFQAGRRGMYGPACEHVREMAKLLPADPKARILGINNRVFIAIGNAAFFSIFEIFLAMTPAFHWVYPWWGALPVFVTVYIPFFLASNFAYDWKPRVQKIAIGGLVAVDLVAMILFAGILHWI